MAKSFDHTSLPALGCIWLVALFLYILTHCISPLLPDLIVDVNLSHSIRHRFGDGLCKADHCSRCIEIDPEPVRKRHYLSTAQFVNRLCPL